MKILSKLIMLKISFDYNYKFLFVHFLTGFSDYSISSDAEQIQTEIMKNGPVEAAFTVYADFVTYKSGKECENTWVGLDTINPYAAGCLFGQYKMMQNN